MKRKAFIISILTLLFCVLGLTLIGCESTTYSKGLEYKVNIDGKTCIITGIGSCTDTDISIPKSIKGYKVVSIGDYAFSENNSLTSVSIPDSVETIGVNAFYGCENLQYNEKGGLNYLGNKNNPYLYLASVYDENIETAEIDTNCKIIGTLVFSSCASLTNITIPNSVTSVGINSFPYKVQYNTKNGLDYLGNDDNPYLYLAKSDSDITTATIESGCKIIGDYAFESGFSLLTVVIIPESVISINQPFINCRSLVSIVVDENNSKYKSIDGDLYSKDGKTLIKYAQGKTNSYFSIPKNVTDIKYYAFSNSSFLTAIIIHENVASIGTSVFLNCSSLASIVVDKNNPKYKSIDGDLYLKDGKTLIRYAPSKPNNSFVIPNGVESIDSYAFSNCEFLTTITIPESVTSIEKYAFSSCTSLTNIAIPESITSIGYQAFFNCTSLTSIIIPNSVTSIGSSAFYYCTSLTSITIPDSVTSIGFEAFYNCTSLTTVNYTGTIDSWVEIWFGNSIANPLCYAKKIYINGELVEEVELTTATKISSYAFYNCTSFTSITIPDSVTSIGISAFSNCTSLTSITIPDSVTSIEDYAFSNCKNLLIYCEDENKPDGWRDKWNSSNCPVVWNCNSNDIATDECVYILVEGIRYAIKDGSAEVVQQPSKITYANIISFVNYKGNSYKVTRIGDSAFYYCTSLTSVTIPDSVTSVGNFAFCNCTSLRDITIPNSVKTIGDSVFSRCTSLINITIGNNVESIGKYSFGRCDALESVTFKDTSTWYMTSNRTDWENKTGGTQMSVTNKTNNSLFLPFYDYYYWYKK